MTTANILNSKEMQKEVLSCVEIGWSLTKAAEYVGITRQTIYNYQKLSQPFAVKIKRARMFANEVARRSVIKHMAKDGKLALKYLQMTDRENFHSKRNVDHTSDGKALTMSGLLTALNQDINGSSDAKKSDGQKLEDKPSIQDNEPEGGGGDVQEEPNAAALRSELPH